MKTELNKLQVHGARMP